MTPLTDQYVILSNCIILLAMINLLRLQNSLATIFQYLPALQPFQSSDEC